MTNKATTPPKRRPSGTIKNLATGLSLSRRRVHSLLAAGMPEVLTEAKQWMQARSTTGGPDSPEQLRAERIQLIIAQRCRVEMENKLRAGELVLASEAMESATLVCGATRAAMMKLARDLPPQITGLTEAKISRLLRVEFVKILADMADGKFFDSPETLAIVEAARREVGKATQLPKG